MKVVYKSKEVLNLKEKELGKYLKQTSWYHGTTLGSWLHNQSICYKIKVKKVTLVDEGKEFEINGIKFRKI